MKAFSAKGLRHSNSLGPMWSAPHIEGQFLRDEITRIVRSTQDWFQEVYDLLERHQLPSEWRHQFYAHAQGVQAQ
jgi:hypothetical protein